MERTEAGSPLKEVPEPMLEEPYLFVLHADGRLPGFWRDFWTVCPSVASGILPPTALANDPDSIGTVMLIRGSLFSLTINIECIDWHTKHIAELSGVGPSPFLKKRYQSRRWRLVDDELRKLLWADNSYHRTQRVKTVARLLEDAGYTVEVLRVGETYRATACGPRSSPETLSGPDPYKVVCELGAACGIELETQRIVRLLEDNGYTVRVSQMEAGSISPDLEVLRADRYYATARDYTGAMQEVTGTDRYKVLCELATACGIGLRTETLAQLLQENGYTIQVFQDGETYYISAWHPTAPLRTATGTDRDKLLAELAAACGVKPEGD